MYVDRSPVEREIKLFKVKLTTMERFNWGNEIGLWVRVS